MLPILDDVDHETLTDEGALRVMASDLVERGHGTTAAGLMGEIVAHHAGLPGTFDGDLDSAEAVLAEVLAAYE